MPDVLHVCVWVRRAPWQVRLVPKVALAVDAQVRGRVAVHHPHLGVGLGLGLGLELGLGLGLGA